MGCGLVMGKVCAKPLTLNAYLQALAFIIWRMWLGMQRMRQFGEFVFTCRERCRS